MRNTTRKHFSTKQAYSSYLMQSTVQIQHNYFFTGTSGTKAKKTFSSASSTSVLKKPASSLGTTLCSYNVSWFWMILKRFLLFRCTIAQPVHFFTLSFFANVLLAYPSMLKQTYLLFIEQVSISQVTSLHTSLPSSVKYCCWVSHPPSTGAIVIASLTNSAFFDSP